MTMSKLIGALTTAASLVMAAVPLSAIATAAHAGQTHIVGSHIKISDLDFSRAGDAIVFRSRVDWAAFNVCRFAGKPLPTQYTCHKWVRQEAVDKLNDDQRAHLELAQGPAVQQAWLVANN
jgi:UrcA family protein